MTFGTGLLRPGKTALALGSALAAALLAGACFNPPAGAVQFACDPAGDAACPAGYECRDDGCCHREGSDGEDGACKLGVGGVTVGPPTGGLTTGGGTGTGTGTTGEPGSSGGSDGSGSSGATGDASTSSGSTTSSSGSGSTTSGSPDSTSTGSQTTG